MSKHGTPTHTHTHIITSVSMTVTATFLWTCCNLCTTIAKYSHSLATLLTSHSTDVKPVLARVHKLLAVETIGITGLFALNWNTGMALTTKRYSFTQLFH